MAHVAGHDAKEFAQIVPAVAADTNFDVEPAGDELPNVPRGKKAFTEMSNSDTIMYHATSLDDPSKWEVGLGTFDSVDGQLDRSDANVLASSNSDNTVEFLGPDGEGAMVLVEGIAYVTSENDFTVTNWTEDFDLDANASTAAINSDVLGTLINELIKAGVISGSVSA